MSTRQAHVTLSRPWDGYWRTRPKFWTTDRLFRLAGYIERGMTDAEIAAEFDTTVNAVMLARKRHGVSSRTEANWSARRVADLLGVGCAKSVTRWIVDGHLRGKRGQVRGPNRQWYVRYEDIMAFLENPDTHHLWQPERITDSAVREWATELWTGPFLTPGEVADRCYVLHSAVNDWIRSGRLPALRNGNWWVRESDLEGFVPPHQRDRKGLAVRRYTPEEDALILELRSQGATYTSIGKRLNRTFGSVHGRYKLLVELEPAS